MDERTIEFLKYKKPVPASDEDIKKYRRFSAKILIIMIGIMVACAIIGLIKHDLVVLLVIGGVFCAVALFLELKDKIKYFSYERIEVVHVYVQNILPGNGGYSLKVASYDIDKNDIVTNTIFIDRMDGLQYEFAQGKMLKMLVGVKKSKIHYIAMK